MITCAVQPQVTNLIWPLPLLLTGYSRRRHRARPPIIPQSDRCRKFSWRARVSSRHINGQASDKQQTSRYQEDFHSFATLSFNPEELRATVSRHLGIDWDPESVGHPFSRQAVFVGIYDGCVMSIAMTPSTTHENTGMVVQPCHNTCVKSCTAFWSQLTGLKSPKCLHMSRSLGDISSALTVVCSPLGSILFGMAG